MNKLSEYRSNPSSLCKKGNVKCKSGKRKDIARICFSRPAHLFALAGLIAQFSISWQTSMKFERQ
jgi:hypothetical protein